MYRKSFDEWRATWAARYIDDMPQGVMFAPWGYRLVRDVAMEEPRAVRGVVKLGHSLVPVTVHVGCNDGFDYLRLNLNKIIYRTRDRRLDKHRPKGPPKEPEHAVYAERTDDNDFKF